MLLSQLTIAECSIVQKDVLLQLKTLSLESGCLMVRAPLVWVQLQVAWSGGHRLRPMVLDQQSAHVGLMIFFQCQKMEHLKMFRVMKPG